MTRTATKTRTTSETTIEVSVNLDGTGLSDVQTPIGFLTHMVEQLARHGLFDLTVKAEGDTHIDGHHTTEDLALVLGQAFSEALGDRVGIHRYGSAVVPMDETCIRCAVDLSGRPFFVYKVDLPKAMVGEFSTELGEVFFEAFARGAAMNLHLHKLEGDNLHHILEASFKALARALRKATEIDPRRSGVPSTKGTLTE